MSSTTDFQTIEDLMSQVQTEVCDTYCHSLGVYLSIDGWLILAGLVEEVDDASRRHGRRRGEREQICRGPLCMKANRDYRRTFNSASRRRRLAATDEFIEAFERWYYRHEQAA